MNASTDWAGFIQDDIKVTPRLTMNAGLRYEYFGPASEINGRLPNFDPSIAAHQVPDTGSFSGFLLPSNFPGQLPSGYQRTSNSGMWNSDYDEILARESDSRFDCSISRMRFCAEDTASITSAFPANSHSK